MGKKMTLSGMELRRAVRADIDANPAADHLEFRRKHGVQEGIVASALTRTVAEWDTLIAATREGEPAAPVMKAVVALDVAASKGAPAPPAAETRHGTAPPLATSALGLEQGFVKFARKPAKMGEDYIFWIPRVYVKNGLVDTSCEYEVFLRKKST
nr:hypothetical protein [Candidatus Sigynarchaeum springense]